MFVETMVRSHWKDGCPAVERCYGLSARSRNESISACWPVRLAARGQALEIQMPADYSEADDSSVHYSTVAGDAVDLFCPILGRAGQARDDD